MSEEIDFNPPPGWGQLRNGMEPPDMDGAFLFIENQRLKAELARQRDHTLLLRQIVSGRARWEPFEVSSQGRGEVCVDGLRYVTHLDADGCPVVGEGLRGALLRAEGGEG